MKIRLVPSENPKAKDKLNAVEIVGLDGKVKRFRRINPANLSESAREQYAIKINEAAAQQINMNDEQTDVLREKPHERWQRIIREGRNTDLWIPVDARTGHTGQYLVTEPDLSHYIRKNLADYMGADQVRLLVDRYGSAEKIWQHIQEHEKQQNISSVRVARASNNLSPENKPKVSQPKVESVAVNESKEKTPDGFDRFTLIGTARDENEELKSKKKNDDAIYVGRNRQGNRVIAVADGVSGSARGDLMAQKLVKGIEEGSGSNIRTLKASIKLGHERGISAAERIDQTAAATLVAGVVDKENVLHLASRGDSPAYLLRDGKVILLTPIQNKQGEIVYKKMQEGMTKKAAKKFVKDNYPELRNTPKIFSADDPSATVYEKQIQLKAGDQLFFVTDGALDGYETITAMENAMKKAAEQANPAATMGKYAYELNGGKTRRDDISVGYMKI